MISNPYPEIEEAISQSYRNNADCNLHYENDRLGNVQIAIEKYSWFSVVNSRVHLKAQPLYLEAGRPAPTILMFFQTFGNTSMQQRQTIRIPEKHHSLNYIPEFESGIVHQPHESSQNVVIKVEPEKVRQILADDQLDWEQFPLLSNHGEAFVTLHNSQQMNPLIDIAVNQLLRCPYQGTMAAVYKDSLVRSLLVHQLMTFHQVPAPRVADQSRISRADEEVLHGVKDYLDQHFLDPLSLDTICRHFGINSFKLKYGFKKLFATSVIRYIDHCKMNYAHQMLLEADYSIGELSDELGFNHYTNFSSAFKRRYGYSPSAAKKGVGGELAEALPG